MLVMFVSFLSNPSSLLANLYYSPLFSAHSFDPLCLLMQVTHNTDAVVAALSFCGQLDRHRHMPRSPRAEAPGNAARQARQPDVPDGKQPCTLAERAKQAFATHNLPVTRKLSVPATSVHLTCPGVPLPLLEHSGFYREVLATGLGNFCCPLFTACQRHAVMPDPRHRSVGVRSHLAGNDLVIHRIMPIGTQNPCFWCAGIVGVIQYHHTDARAGGAAESGGTGSSCTAPPQGSEYELVAAVSAIRGQVFGEDFQDFMHRGATLRTSLHAYIDLFCYQAPTARSAFCSLLLDSQISTVARILNTRFNWIFFPADRLLHICNSAAWKSSL